MTEPTASSSNNSPTEKQNIAAAAKGGGIIFAGRLFEFAGRFVIGVLLARFMGSEQYGVYALADTVLSLGSGIALLGVGAGLVHFIPVYKNQGNTDRLWGVILLGLFVPLGFGILSGIGVLFYADSIVNWFSEPLLLPVLSVVAFAIPFNVLMLSTISATQGFKRMHYKVIAQDIILTVVKLVLIIPFIFLGLNAFLALSVSTVGIIIASIVSIYFLHTKLFSLIRPLNTAQFPIKQLTVFSLPVYFTTLINSFGLQLQTILLGILNSSIEVGIFTASLRVGLLGKMFHSSIVIVAMPYVSDLYSRREWKQLAHFYQTVTKWTFTFNLPMFLIVLLFAKPILLIFGESFVYGLEFSLFGELYSAGVVALILLTFANTIGAATGICGVMITMTERPGLNTFNSALALGSTLLLNLWLIPIMGIVGAALAQVVAVVILNTTRLVQVFYLYQMSPYNRTFVKPLIAALTSLGVTYLIITFLFTEIGILGIMINITVLLAIYAGMIFMLGLTEDDYFILNKIFNRLKPLLPRRS
ncbi:flippase [Anaerolineales bacterium HSG25]|nr:flippase [Anaerolineales bacterium HSG25]